MGCKPPSPCPMWALSHQAGVQKLRSSSGFGSSWCGAGLCGCVYCSSPGETIRGTLVLRSLLTMAWQRCSTLPRWQSFSVLKSHGCWWTTGPSEVTLVVFCLSVLGSESGFHPHPGGTRGLWRVRCQVPLPRAPRQWDELSAQTYQLAQPHAFFSGHVLAPRSAHTLPCLIFKAILFSEIPSAVPSVHPSFSPSLKRFQQGPSKAEQICRRGNVEWSLQQLLKCTSAGFGRFRCWRL